jgi:hypothetical protein
MTTHVLPNSLVPVSALSSPGSNGAENDFHTDLGNARRFVSRHGENIRFIPEWKKWIVWNGSRWEIDDDGAAMRLAKETVEAMYSEALGLANEQDRTALLKHAIKAQAEARLKAMVSLAESEATVVLPANRLDADPWVLGVQNGVVELKTGKFRPARREDLITKRANVVFDPNACCPNWLKFLDTVRDIFRSYLKLGSINLLMRNLRHRGNFTKPRKLKNGQTVGNIAFTRGPLAHLLRNRFYIGEVAFKGEILTGEQPPIVDRELFEAVQAKLDERLNNHKITRTSSEALLVGRLFDDRGNRMSPSHARKRGIKYRYYLSSALLQGEAERAGSVRRAPAVEIESLVIRSVRDELKLTQPVDDPSLVNTYITRVEIQPEQLVIQLAPVQKSNRQTKGEGRVLHIPWRKTPSTRRRELLLPKDVHPEHARANRSETRAKLVASIAQGRRWLGELVVNPTLDAAGIANREGCSLRKVNMTISLAFLAPDLVKAAIEGRLPQGMGVARLCDMPAEWSRQYEMLGLSSQ